MRKLRVFIAIAVALITIMIAAHMNEIRKIPKDYESIVYDNASVLCKQASTLYQQGETIVELSKIAVFEWDEVYFFPYYISYTGGAQLTYKEIGYQWGYIKESPIGEGYEHVIFTNQGRVVCYIPGTVQALLNETTSVQRREDFDPTQRNVGFLSGEGEDKIEHYSKSNSIKMNLYGEGELIVLTKVAE